MQQLKNFFGSGGRNDLLQATRNSKHRIKPKKA